MPGRLPLVSLWKSKWRQRLRQVAQVEVLARSCRAGCQARSWFGPFGWWENGFAFWYSLRTSTSSISLGDSSPQEHQHYQDSEIAQMAAETSLYFCLSYFWPIPISCIFGSGGSTSRTGQVSKGSKPSFYRQVTTVYRWCFETLVFRFRPFSRRFQGSI